MTLFAFGLRTPDPVRYLAAILRATRDWPLNREAIIPSDEIVDGAAEPRAS